ncbi:IMP cyclohydrolase [Salinirubellus salinus]|jgi:IMP cyclohydrolase|uniref:IMP cyclohydrolase n=1 Tax=Salinirubellus salinus TaxID=1364945 RepID=A0A9E7R0P2_9EURY|nr:IMP cyclohydrolase [Salinirubellus salinus]UWM53525.1 IMP cyclohydrolase [Salinirubellus salinus]
MYVGRFVVVGPGIAAYRVSSRSFPDRRVVDRDGTLTVGPTADAPETDNPYVSYNCLRPAERAGEDLVVVGNGSHVDPVTEKLELGYPPRDALALSLLALDFEKDDYDTPRVAGVVSEDEAFVATVRRDALVVEAVEEPTLVATYETDSPEPFDLGAETASEAARELYDLDLEHPVCAAAATVGEAGVETAFHNG